MARTSKAFMSKILKKLPTSVRALARESGVDHATLLKIRCGELGLSDDAAKRIGKALRKWERICGSLADEVEAFIEEREE